MEKTKYYMTRAQIMTAAHGMTRAALARHPDDDRRAVMSAALREAWNDARSPQTLEQFLALPDWAQAAEMKKFAVRCPEYAARAVRAVKDPETGETLRDERTGKPVTVPAPASWAQWMIPRAKGGMELEPWKKAIDTIISEMWIGIARQPDDIPLRFILARAARAACVRLSRQYRDAPRQQDGSINDPVPYDPAYHAGTSYPSPEAAILTREAIRTAAKDDIDITILDQLAQGRTLDEAGEAVGMSKTAVIKRRAHMEDRYHYMSDDACNRWLKGDDMTLPAEEEKRPRQWLPDNAASAPGSWY